MATANDYDYVNGDPVNGYDLTGKAKGGKENIRDTGLIGLSDDEIQRLARDKTIPKAERERYKKEEKFRKMRRSGQSNFSKIGGFFSGSARVVAGAATAVAGVWGSRRSRVACVWASRGCLRRGAVVGAYRWRTNLRGRLPYVLADLIPKGRRDCGQHEWYNSDYIVERCYHGVVGIRPYRSSETPGERARSRCLPDGVYDTGADVTKRQVRSRQPRSDNLYRLRCLPRRYQGALRARSEPSIHPVEGGSANDYDYVNGDPVKGVDLNGFAASCRKNRSLCSRFRALRGNVARGVCFGSRPPRSHACGRSLAWSFSRAGG